MKKMIAWYVAAAPLQLALIGLLGVIGGASGAALIALIGQSLTAGSDWSLVDRPWLILLAVGLALLLACIELLTKWLHLRLHMNRIRQLQEDIVVRFFGTELSRIERIGPASIYATLVNDVYSIAAALNAIPGLAVSFSVVIGCALYLLWLAPFALMLLACIALPGVIVVLWLHRVARGHFRKFLERRNVQLSNYVQSTEGIKEIKLSRDKQVSMLTSSIRPTAVDMVHTQLRSEMWFAAGASWVQVLYLLTIVGAFFLVANQWVSKELLASLTLTTVFMKEHVGRMIGSAPAWSRAIAAHQKLLSLDLAELSESRFPDELPEHSQGVLTDGFVVRQMRYHYKSADTIDRFEVGPLDCDMRPGTVVFVIGENGGGKSTFVKLLAGLYCPDEGSVKLDGELAMPGNAQEYREKISVVFTDSHVFKNLPVGVNPGSAERISLYLKRLELTHKVTIESNIISTTDLSHGQRKRLALLHAIAENRPVMILDEWAATQDPRFKRFFYRELLPELRASGKLVVVVTHDIEFRDCADQVLRMEYGRFVPADL